MGGGGLIDFGGFFFSFFFFWGVQILYSFKNTFFFFCGGGGFRFCTASKTLDCVKYEKMSHIFFFPRLALPGHEHGGWNQSPL